MTISNKTREQQGFTLIELMLAMAFLSVILLLATVAFIQAMTVYNKGITVKQINETGRSLTTDLNRSTNNATSFSISAQTPARYMCIGKTAYLWNLVNTPPNERYRVNNKDITIVRTSEGVDARAIYCRDNAPRTIDPSHVTNLVGDQARVLSVSVLQPDAASASALEAPLVRFTITIGTSSSDGATNPIVAPGNTYWSCPAGGLGSFCAVGTYSTTIYIPSGS